jgi:hypothetical protein
MIARDEDLPEGVSSVNGTVQQGSKSVNDAECLEGDQSVFSCEEQNGSVDFLISKNFLTLCLFSQSNGDGFGTQKRPGQRAILPEPTGLIFSSVPSF